MGPRRKVLLFGISSAIAGCLALFVTQGKYFSVLPHDDRAIRAADRQFLDDALGSERDGDLRDQNPLAAADANRDRTAMIASGNESAPRAELVVNSEIVKRAELVVHGGRIKRAELARPGRQ